MHYETFWPEARDLRQGERLAMVLRRLESGREKYSALGAWIRVLGPLGETQGDRLTVRSRVGHVLGEWAVRIEEEIEDLVPGVPYDDYYAALREVHQSS